MGGHRHRPRVRLAERQRRDGRFGDLHADRQHVDCRAERGSCRGITVDPTNANRAWITYSGYNANTPATPGHVFQVDYNPTTHTATWTDIDNGTGPIGDLPVTGIARDAVDGHALRGHGLHRARGHAGKNGTFDGNWRPAATGCRRSRWQA